MPYKGVMPKRNFDSRSVSEWLAYLAADLSWSASDWLSVFSGVLVLASPYHGSVWLDLVMTECVALQDLVV
jgi:hypothetical protein